METNSVLQELDRWSAAEVADLLSAGYRLMFKAKTLRGGVIIRLKHANNGNIMLLKTYPDGFVLRKNGSVVKTVTANLRT